MTAGAPIVLPSRDALLRAKHEYSLFPRCQCNDEAYRTQWHELLKTFTNVKTRSPSTTDLLGNPLVLYNPLDRIVLGDATRASGAQTPFKTLLPPIHSPSSLMSARQEKERAEGTNERKLFPESTGLPQPRMQRRWQNLRTVGPRVWKSARKNASAPSRR